MNLTREQSVAKMTELHQQLTALSEKPRLSKADNVDFARATEEFQELEDHIGFLDRAASIAACAGESGGGGGLRVEHGSPTPIVDPDAPPAVRAALAAASGGGDWGTRAAGAITAIRSETRAVTSGSIDLPSLVEPNVVAKPRPARLIDLLVTRQTVGGNAFEYFQQTVRTNNAAPVADNATKPTSVFTVTPVEDRCRVIAHLTEPIPLRLLADHAALRVWLNSELVEGVLDALESQVIAGNGSGENMTGILAAAGTTAVAFTTDVVTTLRSALTALQQIGVQPNAWALSPGDAQTVDLTRWSTAGGYLTDGYANTNAASANIFGDTSIQRVVSPSVPEGTAILGDWSKVGLWVREGVRIDIDAGGDLFTKNQAVLRGETRVGAGVLMPPAFAVIDLAA
jgi:HK97 family phage major capsid protein